MGWKMETGNYQDILQMENFTATLHKKDILSRLELVKKIFKKLKILYIYRDR